MDVESLGMKLQKNDAPYMCTHRSENETNNLGVSVCFYTYTHSASLTSYIVASFPGLLGLRISSGRRQPGNGATERAAK